MGKHRHATYEPQFLYHISVVMRNKYTNKYCSNTADSRHLGILGKVNIKVNSHSDPSKVGAGVPTAPAPVLE